MYDREYLFFPFRCQFAVPGLQRFRFRERTLPHSLNNPATAPCMRLRSMMGLDSHQGNVGRISCSMQVFARWYGVHAFPASRFVNDRIDCMKLLCDACDCWF